MKGNRNLFWAVPLIAVGLVWQLKNMDYVSYDVFRIIVSWQMLLMYIGVVNFIKQHYVGGLITFGVGLVFLLPRLGVMDYDWLHINWPIALIVIGIIFLFKPRWKKSHRDWNKKKWDYNKDKNSMSEYSESSYSSEEGYVETSNYFGSVKQIVLDPVFKGARISNAFGGTVIDLRHTSLDAPETYIDIDCTFGGVEIYLPSNWFLQLKTVVIMGGCDDKRFLGTVEVDKEHMLIVKGNVTFGGVEFKS